MKKIQSVLYTLIILCFCSCEKDSDVKLPKVEEKLVINCAISPQDEGVSVNVSLSQPIFNTSPTNEPHPSVTNATVIITSGAAAWTLPYDSFYKAYMVDSTLLKLKAGMTYTLSVSTPEGKFVHAQTTIPYANTTLSCATTPNSAVVNNLTAHARWQDPGASADYYKLELFNTNKSNYLTFRGGIVNDDENPGGTLKRDWDVQYQTSTNDTLNAILYTISSELYNYYDRLSKVNNSGGPFSEPISMDTNIEGGFGIFGSFNRYKIRVLP